MRHSLLLITFICSSCLIKAEGAELNSNNRTDFLSNIYPILFNSGNQTESAYKLELKRRFQNGYTTGPGFSDDISKAINDAAIFRANPSEFRPTFGAANDIINSGQILHSTAVFAYAIDDIELANAVAIEILEITESNDLHSQFWQDVVTNNIRWDSGAFNGWIQAAKAKKLKDSYSFIKNTQNALSATQKML